MNCVVLFVLVTGTAVVTGNVLPIGTDVTEGNEVCEERQAGDGVSVGECGNSDCVCNERGYYTCTGDQANNWCGLLNNYCKVGGLRFSHDLTFGLVRGCVYYGCNCPSQGGNVTYRTWGYRTLPGCKESDSVRRENVRGVDTKYCKGGDVWVVPGTEYNFVHECMYYKCTCPAQGGSLECAKYMKWSGCKRG